MYNHRDLSYHPSTANASQKQPTVAHHTSSAFSPNANPNEDWTQISDLAERRRIQNRIAQRNYRKKLKKRLEDLERRAGSNSTSPEPKDEEQSDDENLLSSSFPNPTLESSPDSTRHAAVKQGRSKSDGLTRYQPDDRSMFSHQHTRQLSTSPPPFSYASYSRPDECHPTLQSASQESYMTLPCSMAGPEDDLQLYSSYQSTLHQNYPTYAYSQGASVKQERYGEDEMSPFSMSYASLAGVEPAYSNLYQDSLLHTPPLSDSYELSSEGSPHEYNAFPTTPLFLPLSPTLDGYLD